MKKIEVNGMIERIVRQATKQNAEIVLMIPNDKVADIPLGAVSLTIQAKQEKLFDGVSSKVVGKDKKKDGK